MATKQTAKSRASKEIKKPQGQLGFYFDQTRCDACYACIIACKDWHDVPAGPASWMRVSTIERGKYPNPFLAFKINACYHCGHASCEAACPVEAISKREADGIVVVDRDKCLGWEKCGFPCSNRCPAGNDVLGFISLIREGKYAGAWELLIEGNPFPGVCGRICTHPCESACNRGKVDDPIAIHALERFAAEYAWAITPLNITRNQKKIAIVGSGPAGLACAYNLARRGYRATVFEALSVVGGMLRVGIPDYRLPGAVLDRDIDFIKSVGVEIKTGMGLGQNLTTAELDKFDAVFLAVGAHSGMKLGVEGEDSPGVFDGVAFLRQVNLGEKVDVGDKVAVIGGGNVAIDSARGALRLGAKEVSIIYRRARAEMPASPEEVEAALEEGIEIAFLAAPVKIGRRGGWLALTCKRMALGEPDASGRRRPVVIKGSEFSVDYSAIISAIGQVPDLSFLPKDIKVNQGMISVDEDGATSRPKYFAGGDAALSDRKVAWAIGSGRRTAQAIDRYLRGVPKERPVAGPTRESKMTETDFMKKEARVAEPRLPASARRHNFEEVELGLTLEKAKMEAGRCLICHGMCSIACPYDAPQFGAEDNPKMQKCTLCMEEWSEGNKPLCVRSCTMRALDAGPVDELRAKYGDVRKAEGFTYSKKNEPSITFKPKAFRR